MVQQVRQYRHNE